MAGHTYSRLLVHVVFRTKDRYARIKPAFRDHLHKYMAGIARNEFGRALEISGTTDHIHLLLSLRTDVPVADAMRKLKSLSSGWVHKSFPNETGFGWQAGYGAFSVSESNAATVIRYIKNQPEHHKRQTFDEEFAALLKRHRIDPAPTRSRD